jgi:hypothetical protein
MSDWIVSSKLNVIVLPDLSAGTVYNLTITTGANETVERTGCENSVSNSFMVSTADGIPLSSLRNFSAIPLSKNEVRLQWMLPDGAHQGGVYVAYELFIQRVANQSLANSIYLDESSIAFDFSHTISNPWIDHQRMLNQVFSQIVTFQEAGIIYDIKLRASTSAGFGPNTTMYRLQTLEDSKTSSRIEENFFLDKSCN